MRIVYIANSLAHKRVLEPFKKHPDLEQFIVAPETKPTTNLVPEDYKDCGIQNIHTFKNMAEAQSIVDKLNPDIIGQTGIFNINSKAKKVYLGHGMIGKHVKAMGKVKTWGGFNLYCGASWIFKDYITYAADVDPNNVLIDALPQFDLLYDPNYYNAYKTYIVSKLKPDAAKVILFLGFCCKDRGDFKDHNEDYFKTVIELEKIARKNNWLALIKPRQSFSEMWGFLNGNGPVRQYAKAYKDIQSSKYLHFISTNSHIYRYYFADVIVCNGCSTGEIEACLMNKPLILVRTKSGPKYDPFDTDKTGAATVVRNINDLETAMNKPANVEQQKNLIKSLGITNDGMAHRRIQDKVVELWHTK